MTGTGPPRRSNEEVLELVRAALEPVLLPRGFAAAQGGSPDGELGVTWCAGYEDLAERFPRLPSTGEQPAGVGACVDVILTARHDGTTWRLLEVALESRDLGRSLHELGDPDAAARAGALRGAALEASLPVLRDLLDDLFELGGGSTAGGVSVPPL